MVKIDGEWAALLADLGDDDDNDFPLLSKSIGQIFPFSLSSPIGGAYLAKPYSAKPESAVQESAKPYFAKPGNC